MAKVETRPAGIEYVLTLSEQEAGDLYTILYTGIAGNGYYESPVNKLTDLLEPAAKHATIKRPPSETRSSTFILK